MTMCRFINLLCFTCIVVLVTACGGGSSTTPADEKSTAPTCDDFSCNNTQTAENLKTVLNNLQPASLTSDTVLGENPCATSDGFFDCQPKLLKLYLSFAKSMIELSQQTVAGLSQDLASLKPGDSGSVLVTQDSTTLNVDYEVTTYSQYRILIKDSQLNPIAYFDVNSSLVHITADIDSLSNGKDSGQLDIIIDFTDLNNYQMDMVLTDAKCDATDVGAPQNMAIKLQRASGVLKGKAMLYHPRFIFSDAAPMTCKDAGTPASKMLFYTDFVGDDSNTTAAIYLMPPTVDNIANITDYAASAFCTNFPDWCTSDGHAFGDPNPVTDYGNDFCVTGSASTWNAACSSSESDIATPNYSDSSNWIVPMEFTGMTVTVPDSL